MKYKKWLYGIATLTVCFMLTGCCMSHEWEEATCTEPKTCTKCGKTEGETLEHIWVEATCAEPKHCSVCNKTEGDTLEHTWLEATCAEPKHCSICGETEGSILEHTLTEANYQQAATCEVCGATVGEPLQPDCEKYGFAYVTETDKDYPFVTKCQDSDDLTTGRITFSDYQTFTSDTEHEAMEGYEWKTVTATIVFDDENANEYGMGGFAGMYGDFYNMPLNETEDSDTFTVNYNGKDFTECQVKSEWLTSSNEVWVIREDGKGAYYQNQIRYVCRVPVGYDGIIISLWNYDVDQKIMAIGDSIETIEDVALYMGDKNTITFRLQ